MNYSWPSSWSPWLTSAPLSRRTGRHLERSVEAAQKRGVPRSLPSHTFTLPYKVVPWLRPPFFLLFFVFLCGADSIRLELINVVRSKIYTQLNFLYILDGKMLLLTVYLYHVYTYIICARYRHIWVCISLWMSESFLLGKKNISQVSILGEKKPGQ